MVRMHESDNVQNLYLNKKLIFVSIISTTSYNQPVSSVINVISNRNLLLIEMISLDVWYIYNPITTKETTKIKKIIFKSVCC